MNSTPASEFKTSVIGVDLGSFYTKVAAVEKGVVDIITNEANLRQTPTVVGYGPKERLMGESGYLKMKSNLANTVVGPQRYLGFQESEYSKEEGKYASCAPKYDSQNITFKVNCQGTDQRLTPEQIIASFLNKVESIVQLNKFSNKYEIIAVPNYLTHHERKALINAIHIARESHKGNYGYQLINESTAVGFDYGFYKMNEFPQKEEEAKITLFVDFGHSKLSVYAMKFTKNYQKVIYQKHLRQLGCKQLDQLMFQFYADIFEKANPNMELSVKESKRAVLKLFENIQKQRKVLSGNSDYDFNIECLLEDNDISYSMNREQFEQISQPVFEQISELFTQVKQKLLELGANINHIELLGGGSRIPAFIKTVSSVFGVEPSRTLNSSESIARGAALCAAMQSSLFRVKDYYSFDLCGGDLVCSWKGQGQSMQSQRNEVMIYQQNETSFDQKKVQFTLTPTQPKMVFEIKAANTVAGVNAKICSFALNFNNLNEENNKKKIRLEIQVDGNKLLNKIVAFELGEKEESLPLSDVCFFDKFTQEQINQMVAKEREYLLQDAKIIELYEKRNKFESHLYTYKDQINEASRNRETKDFVNPALLEDCLAFLSQMQEKLQEIENYNQQIHKIEAKARQFFKEVQAAKARYSKVAQELAKLSQFIEGVVGHKIKSIRYYPDQEVDQVKQWVKQINKTLQESPKYQDLPVTAEEINKVSQDLQGKIQTYQAQELRKEQAAQRQYYQPQYSQYNQPRRGNPRSPFVDYDPFNSNYHANEAPRGRGRGRNSNNSMYNSSFFPGFSSFF